jgi:hypothetical protein
MRRYVQLEDIIRIIFEELNLEGLKRMWDGDGVLCHEMIKMIHLVYLLKNRP